MGILIKDNGGLNIKGTTSVILCFLVIWNASAIYYSGLREGVPRTYSGKIVYIRQGYNKWQNYEFTEVQILTAFDDTTTIYLWGYVDLQPNIIYKIYTIRHIERCRMFPWWMNSMWKITNIEVLNDV